jgi:hypothetical protein
MTSQEAPGAIKAIRWGLPGLAALALLLVIYGLAHVPAAISGPPSGLLGLAGVAVMLAMYAAAGRWGLRRASVASVRWGLRFGVLAAVVFVGEMALEYILLPADNSTLGLAEFGLVFVCWMAAGWLGARRGGRWSAGLIAAVYAALISSVIWYGALLALYYVFQAGPQQAQLFAAEGTYTDFTRSGMTDLAAFVMQDYLGAGFFHLLLGPLLAALLGGIAAGFARLDPRKRAAH